MTFDARRARQLKAGEHLTVEHCPGLRLIATRSGRTWTYRFKSPVDQRVRQVRLGAWPALSLQEAIGRWSEARKERDDGVDLAIVRRKTRQEQRAAKPTRAAGVCTVRTLVNDYVIHELRGRRKDRGTNEVQRMFDTMLDEIAALPAADIGRAEAYSLVESYRDIPVQAGKLKSELRAAWAYGLDCGLLPAQTPNWWGEVFKKKLKSKGKKIAGEHIGPVKRCLGSDEMAALIRWLRP